MQFQNPSLDISTFSVLLVLVCIFLFMLRRRRKRQPILEPLAKDFAYEWIAEPLPKATKDLRNKFDNLEELPRPNEIQLVRLGIFNFGSKPIDASEFEIPISVEFEKNTEIILANAKEAHRTPLIDPESVQVRNNLVCISPFTIMSGGTIIINILTRIGGPCGVNGGIKGFGSIRRLN